MKKHYLFPFNEVEKSSDIIIYGAGDVCRQFVEQIKCLNYCNCIFIVDRNYEKIQQIDNIVVNPPAQITSCDFDKIVIASEIYSDEIYDSLLSVNISCDKIVKNIVVSGFSSIEDGAVYISDYSKYVPKHRDSLRNSSIRKIMDEWYSENKSETIALIQKFCSYTDKYRQIPFDTSSSLMPKWDNGYIPPFDAISIYGFLAEYNPRYYVEVGSGNTTLFAAQSIRDNNLRTKIISIDPFPRSDIDNLCYKSHRTSLEDMNLDFFKTLSNEDILLVDNSHRSFPNSDVTVFFTEILPTLPKGILYTLHDIFLPFDYPEKWITELLNWYNEQYLFCSYLLGGAACDKIIFPNAFLCHDNDIIKVCSSLWGEGKLFYEKPVYGCLFWMEKA